jgi:hypothetical protein
VEQQDGATAHTAVIIIAALRRLFPQWAIFRFGDVRGLFVRRI